MLTDQLSFHFLSVLPPPLHAHDAVTSGLWLPGWLRSSQASASFASFFPSPSWRSPNPLEPNVHRSLRRELLHHGGLLGPQQCHP